LFITVKPIPINPSPIHIQEVFTNSIASDGEYP
jgi:hypothetical protein